MMERNKGIILGAVLPTDSNFAPHLPAGSDMSIVRNENIPNMI